MNIGLIDVDDTKFPNLCLMKLSSFYKSLGHTTMLLKPRDVLNGDNLFYSCDKLIGASVFTSNIKISSELEKAGILVAGTGTNRKDVLPDHIEHIFPDYSLYSISDTAYGFLTRGCPRRCPFCIVSDKEGSKSIKMADLSEWWNGQKNIKLLDPNILACPDHIGLLEQLRDSKAYIDVTQGMDARLLSDTNLEVIKDVKIKRIHFAWDNPKDKVVPEKLKLFKGYTKNLKTDYVKHKCYVLTNYWSTLEEDLYRVYWLRDNGFDPYVMIYDKPNAPKEIRRLQGWVNNKRIFRTCNKFDEYSR